MAKAAITCRRSYLSVSLLNMRHFCINVYRATLDKVELQSKASPF